MIKLLMLKKVDKCDESSRLMHEWNRLVLVKGILYMQNGNNWSLSSKLKSKKVLGLIPGWDLPVSSLHVPSVCVVSRWCDGFPSYLTILRGDAHISSCNQLQELCPNL